MNAFGERQHVEKFLPNTIRKVLRGEMVTIHTDAERKRSGSRFYIHARNVSAALLFLSFYADKKAGKFNIAGEREVSNLELAQTVARLLKQPLRYEMVDFHSSRPGHDLRYALDGGVLERAGWRPTVNFDDSLRRTVMWYLRNRRWLEHFPEETEDGMERRDN